MRRIAQIKRGPALEAAPRFYPVALLRDEVVGGGLSRPLVLHDLVGNLLPFVEAVKARTLDGGDVDEYVRPTLIGLDKTIALLTIEPFYSAGSHRSSLSQSLL